MTPEKSHPWPWFERVITLVRHRFWHKLNIGQKLTLGFTLLVALTIIVIIISFVRSAGATRMIRNTDDVRVPAAQESAQAQANLLHMFAAVRGYLAFGEPEFRDEFEQTRQAFEHNLAELSQLSHQFEPANQRHLHELQTIFVEWSASTEAVFELHDDQIEREPALAVFSMTGSDVGGRVLRDTRQLLEQRAEAEPSPQNNGMLKDMAEFQNSFVALMYALRGYVTTGNQEFRAYEYDNTLFLNQQAWDRILQNKAVLTVPQQNLLMRIDRNRNEFLEQVPPRVFTLMEGEGRRKDIILFEQELQPLTTEMQRHLQAMNDSQQQALRNELAYGTQQLQDARVQTLATGIIVVILGFALSFLFRQVIAGPVRRLTRVAEQIRAGDLVVSARVESGDEIGVFAETFNGMTTQLRETLFQIRKEKKRADDLLNVVIPIGVALSSEKDFHQLLERILVEAMAFCHVDRGTLLLREGNTLKFVMIRVQSRAIKMGDTSTIPIPFAPLPLSHSEHQDPVYNHPATYATLKGTSVNIANVYSTSYYHACDLSEIKMIDAHLDYCTVSLLDIPLKNNRNQVLGVLELANVQDTESGQVIPFDANLQQMMETFSSLAVAALEAYIREQDLRRKVQELRIDIDETRRQEYVNEIVNNELFQELWGKARSLRSRNRVGTDTPVLSDEEDVTSDDNALS